MSILNAFNVKDNGNLSYMAVCGVTVTRQSANNSNENEKK